MKIKNKLTYFISNIVLDNMRRIIKTRKIVFIIGTYVILLFVIFSLVIDLHNSNRIPKIDSNNIFCITLVNNLSGQAKAITRHEDITSICKLFNSTDMHIIKNWDGKYKRDGGYSLTFIFTFLSQRTIEIGYYDGSYLINNGDGYSINSTAFENLWNLDYNEAKYTYPGVR